MGSHLVSLEGRHGLGRTLDEIEASLRAEAAEEELVWDIRLVAEEALVNVLDHAYRDRMPGPIEATVSVSATAIRLEIRDAGPPFNPLEVGAAPIEEPLERRSLGGLGVHLMKTLTDEQSYRRQGRSNVLVLVKHRTGLYRLHRNQLGV